MENQTTMNYAGFWLRFLAFIIDAIILNVVKWIMITPLLGVLGFSMMNMDMNNMDPEEMMPMIMAFVGSAMYISVAMGIAAWLYYALMESSARGATIGKMALGIKVVDMEGSRISFLNATGRYFAKILSAIILMIGYIMAAFTDKKQALHDQLAKTLVVKK